MGKVYELSEPITYDEISVSYEIRDKKRLIAKIPNSTCSFLAGILKDNGHAINQLEKELRIGKKLNEEDISSPKYVGICEVRGFLHGPILETQCIDEAVVPAIIIERSN